MKARCNNKNDTNYKRYWWRGITYCDEREKFDNFYNDMFDDYFEWATIDRIDNNWNYSKGNCKWSTYKEQANNRRGNETLDINWVNKNIGERIDIYWIDYRTYYTRVRNWANNVEALTRPVKKYHQLIEYNWKSQTLKQWSDELWIKYKTLYRRLKIKKYPIHIALSQERYDWKTVL